MSQSDETIKLVLLRHGQSEWNRLNLFTGWTDVDLSDQGREEAKAAGIVMKEAGFDFDICYTSYLKRAIHTLNLALESMDREWLPVIKTWRLNERHYGALQGLNKSETAAKFGESQVKIWRRSYDVCPPALNENDEIIGYEFVKLGPMMENIKKGMDAGEALKKATGHYGQWDDAAKYIDPRHE